MHDMLDELPSTRRFRERRVSIYEEGLRRAKSITGIFSYHDPILSRLEGEKAEFLSEFTHF